MSTNLLAGIVFIIVFGIVILIHEIGHFAVGRFFKVEIEEFGIGLPPRMLRLWWGKGHFFLGGQRVEIPKNFNLPVSWKETLHMPMKGTANKVDNQLILQTIEVELAEEEKEEPSQKKLDHVLINESGAVVEAASEMTYKLVKAGEKAGDIELSGQVEEIHPGTEFTLNWLPIGGFNRFKGEESGWESSGGFASAKPGARLAILLAGAAMNLLLGVVIYSIIIAQIGIPIFDIVQIFDVTPGSPAAQAGFRVDDIVLEVNDEKIDSEAELRNIIVELLDQEMRVTLQRGEEIIETLAYPLSSRSANEGALGFRPGPAYDESPSFFTTLSYGAQTTMLHAQEILLLPARMIRGTLSPEEGRFIGFRGIYNIFQQTVDADVESRVEASAAATPSDASPASPTYYTLNLIASLTITLGVFNLLPFPALDGGRIFFLLPEFLFKKRVPPNLENVIHGVGMMLLLGFMLYINVMDFVNPVDMTLP